VLALLLVGCGSQVAGTPGSSTSAPAAATCPDPVHLAPQGVEGAGSDPLPDDLRASAVIACSLENRPVPGDGVWSFVVEKKAAAGPRLDQLVTALRAKDEPTPVTLGCNAILILVRWFAVVDQDGTWVRPRVPITACGQPQDAVLKALDALSWTTVSATKATQVSTEADVARDAAATAAGCVTPFKDMLAIEAGYTAPKSSPGPWPDLGGTVTAVCRYSAAPDEDGTPLLTFESGYKATVAQAAALSAAWKQTGPVAGCGLQHTVVTVLFTANNGWHLVEDDGCHRVLDGDNGTWGQATPELLAALR
jgi:hypothetical protein